MKWIVDTHQPVNDSDFELHIIDLDTDNHDLIASMCMSGDPDYDNEVVRPYANLIAAAPDLIEALEYIVNDVPEPGMDAQLTVTGYNLACAAIAKAKASSV